MKTIKLYIVTLATLLLMPATKTWAENVAQIGETPYATLEAAIAAVVNGQQINLLTDVTLSSDAVCSKLTSGQSFQLELDNHTISAGSFHVKLDKGVMAKTSEVADIFSVKDDVTDAMIVRGVTQQNSGHYAYYAATTMTGVSYIDKEGAVATAPTAVVLDSRMNEEMIILQQGGWFVVNSDLVFNNLKSIVSNINDHPECNFILADGKTLTLSRSQDGFSGQDFSFYGQTNQTGTLELNATPLKMNNHLNSNSPGPLYQYGGRIAFTNGTNPYISANVYVFNGEMYLSSNYTGTVLGNDNAFINIKGGKVIVNAGGSDAIAMGASQITIEGGQVEAIAEGTGGKGMKVTSGSTITLSLRNPAEYPDDYIKATNYDGVVKIANGKTLYDSDDNNTPYTGDGTTALTDTQKAAIAGHTLRASTSVSINDLTVTVEPATYTGSAITPTVTVKNGDTPLAENTDYTISYTGSPFVNADTYEDAITITGMGGYVGTRKENFTISQKAITATDITITPSAGNSSIEYDGSEHSPSFTVTDGATPLVLGTDYELDNTSGNTAKATNTGNYTTRIKGKGNYAGTTSDVYSWAITPKEILIDDITVSPVTYRGTAFTDEEIKAQVSVTVGSTPLTEDTHYTVTVVEGTYLNAATYENAITITGMGNYSGTRTKNFTISQKAITASDITITPSDGNSSIEYDGTEKYPTFTVHDGTRNVDLVLDTDYELDTSGDYKASATNAGDYTTRIKGKGNYTGTIDTDYLWKINPKPITATDITITPSAGNMSIVYDGTAKSPTFTVHDETRDVDLELGTEYELDNNNSPYRSSATIPGIYTTRIKGIGNYKDVTTGAYDWRIVKPITSSDIKITVAPATYTGSAITPEVTITDPINTDRPGGILISGTDYTISYKGSTLVDAKTYVDEIIITGIGIYSGTRTASFTINRKDISLCTVEGNSVAFTGSAIDPSDDIVVKDGSTTLNTTDHYSLSVSNSYTYVQPGTYANAITIEGKGNYTGTKNVNFIITQGNAKNLADGNLLVTSNAVFNGAAQVPGTTTVTVQYGGADLGTDNYDLTFAPGTYVNAQTYSGAVTITAKGSDYYGSVTADYVIAQRNMNDVTAAEVKKMVWTGTELTPVINGNDAATNNISLKLVRTPDDPATTDVNEEDAYNLVANTDYTYTAEPSPIQEAGTYALTFEGRGNFTGTKPLTVHVWKSIDALTIDDTCQKFIITDNDYANFDLNDLDIRVNDGSKELEKGTDYTVEIYPYDADGNVAATAATAITTDCVAQVKIIGTGDYFDDRNDVKAVLLNEYYPRGGKACASNGEAFNADIRLFVDDDFRVTAKLGNQTQSAVVAADLDVLTIQNNTNEGWTARIPFKTGTNADDNLLIYAPLTGIETGAFKGCTRLTGINMFNVHTITEVQNGAFEGCTALRYIDLANAKGFTPKSLERNSMVAAAPFYGVPKQALVYLNGTSFKGENYVYKPGDGRDYFCELFKVYDDMSGSQTNFSESDGYKWAFENRHNFTAYAVENTRMMTVGKHYTTCLPYDLDISDTFKAYTLDATSDKLFGFREVTGTLAKYTPYVIVPTANGQLLSTNHNAVVQELKEGALGVLERNKVEAGDYTMYPCMRYTDKADAQGKYIMQYNGGNPTWMQISSDNASFNPGPDRSCILPMRAYIVGAPSAPDPARQNGRIGLSLTDIDGSTMTFDLDQLDLDDSLYDLQGRKLQTPQRKGVYIINGKKVVVK